MNIIEQIKNLAKQRESINLFVACKELNGLTLFHNTTDLSSLQQLYLSYLYIYYDIYLDIASEQVSNKVLANSIYEDAYLYYKNNKNLFKKDKPHKEEPKGNKSFEAVFSDPNDIVFPKRS